MMQNRVRIESDEGLVWNARIFLRDEDDEWVNVSKAVQGATVKLRTGEVSRAKLDVILVDAEVEAFQLDDQTLKAFASVLRLYGWKVEEPRVETSRS
jgi:hypothetical protein